MYAPLHPLLYNKIGVYMGIHFFLIFALKHRLWVLVRTTINVLSIDKKNITLFHLKIILTAVKKLLYITSACFRNGLNYFSSQDDNKKTKHKISNITINCISHCFQNMVSSVNLGFLRCLDTVYIKLNLLMGFECNV